MWTHSKDSFTWSRTSVIIKTFQLGLSMFVCAFCLEISSFCRYEFPLFLIFFVLSVLWYFPFHMIPINYFIYRSFNFQLTQRELPLLEEIDGNFFAVITTQMTEGQIIGPMPQMPSSKEQRCYRCMK